MTKFAGKPEDERPTKTSTFFEDEEESDSLRAATGVVVWGLVCAAFWLAVALFWWMF